MLKLSNITIEKLELLNLMFLVLRFLIFDTQQFSFAQGKENVCFQKDKDHSRNILYVKKQKDL